MLNIKKLTAEANAFDVASFIGLDVVEKGKNKYILCPGHLKRLGKEDNHIGNCVLMEKGYKCFACNAFVNTHDMVMEVVNCSSAEAYVIMAQAMGGEQYFSEEDEKSLTPKYWLSSEEQAALQISAPLRKTVVVKHRYDGTDIPVQDGLYVLYEKSPITYYKMINDRAIEMKSKYQKILDECCSPNAPKAYEIYNILGDKFDSGIYRNMALECRESIAICEKVTKIFSRAIQNEQKESG